MITYKYSAISKDGVKVTGMIEGFNEMDAVERIKQSCDVVIKLTEVKEKAPGLLNMEIGGNRLNAKAFVVMCSQFAIILNAGIPIARACRLIADKTTDKPLHKMLKQVASDVENGRSMSAALAERGDKLLPQTFIQTIRAGESSGDIARSFETMYQHFDKQAKMRQKVKSALAYPSFVIVVAIAVVIVLMVAVVPTFTQLFADYGGELPLITKSLIFVSNAFRKNLFLIIAVIAVVVLAYKLYTNTESGRLNVAKLALKLPIMGNINLLNATSQFANTMTVMLASGLPMTRAISITAKVIDNYYLSQETGKISGRIEEGKALGDTMREQGLFPDILIDMISVGEETGEMETTLHTISAYYDGELDNAIKAALEKLEPAILVFIAAFAGYIVLAVYIAIFQLYGLM